MSARVTRYQIHDAEGRLVAVHVRRDRADGKDFSWESPDGTSGLNGLPASQVPLYGAERVRAWPASEAVLLVEGGKAADALRAQGFHALGTVTGAASAPGPETLAVLAGRDVILWPDADLLGRRHMATIARALDGVAASVRVFEWAGAPEKGDAHDYLAGGLDAAEFLPAALAGAVPAKEWVQRHEPAATAKKAEREPRRQPMQGEALELDDPEPAADPVDGPELFASIVATIKRFVVVHADTYVVIALWVGLTYLADVVDVLPRLLASSPTKACGKSRLLAVLGALVRRPLPSSNVSASVVFRAIQMARPTLLLDEMDNAGLDDNPDLRSILNSGHERANAWTLRNISDGKDHTPRKFSTWAPIALAGIGSVPAPLRSRCVQISMRRLTARERVERVRGTRIVAELEPLRRGLARWCQDHAAAIGAADPQLPDALDGREADNWTPMLAIADAIGAGWPGAARKAALAACGSVDDDEPAIQLLADLHALFTERDSDRLASDEICIWLGKLEGRPWPEWQKGKPITTTALARLLKRFDAKPRMLRFRDGRTVRGYLRDELATAWASYLRSQPQQVQQPAPIAGETHFSEVQQPGVVADAKNASDPLEQRLVAPVAGKPPGEGVDGLVARLERSGREPAADLSFPSLLEHEEVCARLGLVHTDDEPEAGP